MCIRDRGKIACKSGALMAMCGEMDVSIHGKSAHAGLAEEGIDSIVDVYKRQNEVIVWQERNLKL